jgi:DNA-binding transcriptional MerR regulator
MLENPSNANDGLPPIPARRYFTIGDVSRLCALKPHVIRYWEKEFPQLRPLKRQGNRRYYQRQDLLLVRQIRRLLYDDGYTIVGARQKLEGTEAQKARSERAEMARELRLELEAVLQILRS